MGMCIDVCIDMCMGMSMGMHIGMCTGMRMKREWSCALAHARACVCACDCAYTRCACVCGVNDPDKADGGLGSGPTDWTRPMKGSEAAGGPDKTDDGFGRGLGPQLAGSRQCAESFDMCIDMCMDMCMDMCIDPCRDIPRIESAKLVRQSLLGRG